MEIKVSKQDFTKDNVENLLETATYHSYFPRVSCQKPKHKYDVSCEKWYWCWKEGNSVEFTDDYGDEESIRDKNAPEISGVTIDPNCEWVSYHITLQQAVDSLNYALSKCKEGDFLIECVTEWVSGGSGFDHLMADAIVQCIMFGEIIYG